MLIGDKAKESLQSTHNNDGGQMTRRILPILAAFLALTAAGCGTAEENVTATASLPTETRELIISEDTTAQTEQTEEATAEVTEETAAETTEEEHTPIPVVNKPAYREYQKRYENGEITYDVVYTYDEHDKYIEIDYKDEKLGVALYGYVYDDEGRVITEYNRSGDNYVMREYDENGNHCASVCYENGEVAYTSTSLYDDHGEFYCLVSEYARGYTYKSQRYNNEYDENGRIIKTTRTDYDSGETENIDEYRYDADGNTVYDKTFTVGRKLIGESTVICEYTYDSNGNKLTKSYSIEYADEDKKADNLVYTEDYEYDDKNRMVKRNHYVDGELCWYIEYKYETVN